MDFYRHLSRNFAWNLALAKAIKKSMIEITESQLYILFAIEKSKTSFGWCTFSDMHKAMQRHKRTKSANTLRKEIDSLSCMGLISISNVYKQHRLSVSISGMNLLNDVERAIRLTPFMKPKV